MGGTAVNSGNVGKYAKGGGDNYISDGYIKSVEKIWMDSYTSGTSAITSANAIAIAVIPPNKKITSVEVHLPQLMSAASNTTVFIGTGAAFLLTAANCYLGALQPDGVAAGTDTFDSNKADQIVRLKAQKLGTVTPTGGDTTLYAKILVSGGVNSSNTACTIRSIVRYT